MAVLSIRFSREDVDARLTRAARREGVAVFSLGERLIDEGLRMASIRGSCSAPVPPGVVSQSLADPTSPMSSAPSSRATSGPPHGARAVELLG